jgi:lipopolysaccharide export LptBFGC system permease protein LptF
MRFSVWTVVCVAMMPLLALFVGLSAANPFDPAVDWAIVGLVIVAAAVANYLAKHYATDGR